MAQCGDIQEGNKIVSINGRAATKMSMHEAVSLLQQLFVDKLPLTLEVTDPEPGTTYNNVYCLLTLVGCHVQSILHAVCCVHNAY